MDILYAVARQTDFSLKLAEQIMSTGDNKNRNFVFSPLLLHVGLSMVAFGSGGTTRTQLLGFLRSKSINELELLISHLFTPMLNDSGSLGGPRLSLANGVWVEQSLTLKPAFEDFVVGSCKATLKSVDFKSKANEVEKEANAWVEEKTNGLIEQILPPDSIHTRTRLILATALYFKGTWVYPFHKLLTSDREFFLLDGSSVRAPFMTMQKPQYYRAFDGFKVLRLPYKNGGDSEHKFSMYFFLPEARDGLTSLVDKLGSASGFVECHAPYELVYLDSFFIPKFKISSDFEASKVLKGKGLVLPFLPGGLTEMVRELSAGEELYVEGLFCKSCIEVDEHGTEAASACVVSLRGGGCGLYERKEFVADHPFMFVLREDVSGVVLFAGQVLNPLST
ncbi:Serpin-ZX [Striga hermonthica]|uniref:Serpin-ZX n=1 Tax=Striga hermonthica TaxID=68872 RepID=A0A9N7NBL8_STRHE|nr:Serpin-ZX [Striga hermonthica]